MSIRSMLVACGVLGILFDVVTFFPSIAAPTSSVPLAFVAAQAPNSSNVKERESDRVNRRICRHLPSLP
jgi:hypothetical protein